MLETLPGQSTSAPQLRRVLSTWDLILYGIVAVTPSAPVTEFELVRAPLMYHKTVAPSSSRRSVRRSARKLGFRGMRYLYPGHKMRIAGPG